MELGAEPRGSPGEAEQRWGNERLARPLAAAWGLAEATLFFVVPDVALGFLALRSRRVALAACLWAFAGALVGGALMYAWGRSSPDGAEAALAKVPAIDERTIRRVRGELERSGALAVALGPLRTTPYKIYAVEAGALELPPAAVLAASVPSRLVRFLLTVLVVTLLVRYPMRGWSLDRQRLALGLFWVAIYLFLMSRAPG